MWGKENLEQAKLKGFRFNPTHVGKRLKTCIGQMRIFATNF
ncbi:hypothetical protein LEP1GSC187_2858 [Leptospira santarosai str. ZUN179]|uniref:Uncharacterized protein n=1 Tax=Leptospira santarosai str. ZUN179 TaxID=1049985 RepID=M6UGE9_9LEPT|nr:hypothetical protein LEP1GSC187_2858 [Leptospira santarosai str. ZUN179]